MNLSIIIRVLKSKIYHFSNKGKFGRLGKNTLIYSPLKVNGKSNIFVGDNVTVEYKTWLATRCNPKFPFGKLEIGNNVTLGHFNHIFAANHIVIEDGVLTADRVYIGDSLHDFEDVTTPVQKQPIKVLKPITIGAGSWLGEGVCVIGASIGKGCVIGANSVVCKDIPDYCVAVGAPARVIKRYNFETKQWEKE